MTLPLPVSNISLSLTGSLLCFLLAAAILTGCQAEGQEAPSSSISDTGFSSISETELNGFKLPTLTGDSLSMADYEGQVILLNFWATWCGPCRYEIPDLIELQNEFEPEHFAVIGISLDEDDPDFVRQFAEDMNINYPVALDERGIFAEAFGGVYALPTTYILDKDGQVAHRTIGLFPTGKMKGTIKDLIDAG